MLHLPNIVKTGDRMPTMHASPVVGQPPPFRNSVKTVAGSLCGANNQRVIRMAKKPVMWKIKTTPSTIGRRLAATVLNIMAKLVTAMTSKVPCHC